MTAHSTSLPVTTMRSVSSPHPPGSSGGSGGSSGSGGSGGVVVVVVDIAGLDCTQYKSTCNDYEVSVLSLFTW